MLLMGATLIFTSTPETRESPCKSILEGKYKGEHVCMFMNFEFTCEDCKIINENHPGYICPHRIHWRPMHQNPETVYIARAAYGEGSDEFNREIMSSHTTSAHTFIHPQKIDHLRTKPHVKLTSTPRYVFVSCDPCGSTKVTEDNNTSDYAFVTACVSEGAVVVSSLFIYL